MIVSSSITKIESDDTYAFKNGFKAFMTRNEISSLRSGPKSKIQRKNRALRRVPEDRISIINQESIARAKKADKEARVKKKKDVYLSFPSNANVASERLASKMMEVLDEEGNPLSLFKVTPGIGKTEAALKICIEAYKRKKNAFLACVTTQNMHEVYQRIKSMPGSPKVFLEHGRHEGKVVTLSYVNGDQYTKTIPQNCYKKKDCDRVSQKGFSPIDKVCKNCEHYHYYVDEKGNKTGFDSACPYWKERLMIENAIRKEEGCIVITSHQRMLDRLKQDPPNTAICVFDEDIFPALKEESEWQINDLARATENKSILAFNFLISSALTIMSDILNKESMLEWRMKGFPAKIMRQIRNDLKPKIGKSSLLQGNEIYRLLLAAAYVEMGDFSACESRIEEIVGNIEEDQMDLQIDDFSNMTEEEYSNLPDLSKKIAASEIRKVLSDASNGNDFHRGITFYAKMDLQKNRFVPALRMTNVKTPEEVNFPIIILDAYGSKEIIEKSFGKDVREINIQVPIRENVVISQIFVSSSKANLKKTDNLQYLVNHYILPSVSDRELGKCLFFSTKSNIGIIEETLSLNKHMINCSSMHFSYFYNTRGSNLYSDFDVVFTVGSCNVDPLSLYIIFGALNKGMPIADWKTNVDIAGRYCFSDDALQEFKCHWELNEILQCIFRLRLSSPRSDMSKKQYVYILCDYDLMKDPLLSQAGIEAHVDPEYYSANYENLVAENTNKIYREIGMTSMVFAPFTETIEVADKFIGWLSQKSPRGKLPLTKEQYIAALKRMESLNIEERVIKHVALIHGKKEQEIRMNGYLYSIYGGSVRSKRKIIEDMHVAYNMLASKTNEDAVDRIVSYVSSNDKVYKDGFEPHFPWVDYFNTILNVSGEPIIPTESMRNKIIVGYHRLIAQCERLQEDEKNRELKGYLGNWARNFVCKDVSGKNIDKRLWSEKSRKANDFARRNHKKIITKEGDFYREHLLYSGIEDFGCSQKELERRRKLRMNETHPTYVRITASYSVPDLVYDRPLSEKTGKNSKKQKVPRFKLIKSEHLVEKNQNLGRIGECREKQRGSRVEFHREILKKEMGDQEEKKWRRGEHPNRQLNFETRFQARLKKSLKKSLKKRERGGEIS